MVQIQMQWDINNVSKFQDISTIFTWVIKVTFHSLHCLLLQGDLVYLIKILLDMDTMMYNLNKLSFVYAKLKKNFLHMAISY